MKYTVLYIALLVVYSIGLLGTYNVIEGGHKSSKPEIYCLEWR